MRVVTGSVFAKGRSRRYVVDVTSTGIVYEVSFRSIQRTATFEAWAHWQRTAVLCA